MNASSDEHDSDDETTNAAVNNEETMTNQGDNKFVCKLCPYSTNHKTNMNKHVKGHEPKEGNKKANVA